MADETKPITRSIQDTSKRLGVCPVTVYRLIREGKLRSIKLGKRRLIIDESINALVA